MIARFYRFLMAICLVAITTFTFAQDQYLVSYTLVKSHTKKTLNAHWKAHKIPKIIAPIHYDVDIYEIIYKGKFVDGSMREASGIYFVPKTDKALPYMMYGHGTEIQKGREITDNDAQQGICLGAATDGYIAIYPDYFGIGKGVGNHIYQHAESEANAYIYMLYAIDELNKKLNIRHNGQLFLTGYSQGGHSSFAAHKYLEQLNDPRFQVTASSPMSGAYDMTGDQTKFMFQKYPRPFYLPYLIVSYQEAYKIVQTENIYNIFKAPYDSILPTFFEGDRTQNMHKLNNILPDVPSQVIKEEWIEKFLKDPSFGFNNRLKENNLTEWKPKAPVQLCYCKGDREVSYLNSEVAYATMKKNGVENIKLNNLSERLDHNTCALFAVAATKAFFDRYRDHGKNPKMKDVSAFNKFLINIVKKQEEKKYESSGDDKARF